MSTRTPIRRIVGAAAAAMTMVLALSGCAGGSDAVASGGTFDFVAPGGQTDIFYDPPDTCLLYTSPSPRD